MRGSDPLFRDAEASDPFGDLVTDRCVRPILPFFSQVADDDVYAIFRGYMRFGKQSLCCEGPYPSIDAN